MQDRIPDQSSVFGGVARLPAAAPGPTPNGDALLLRRFAAFGDRADEGLHVRVVGTVVGAQMQVVDGGFG